MTSSNHLEAFWPERSRLLLELLYARVETRRMGFSEGDKLEGPDKSMSWLVISGAGFP